MFLHFTLTSRLIEGSTEPDPQAYQLALADEALLRANHWQNVLVVPRIGEDLLALLVQEEIHDIDPGDCAEQISSFDGGLYLETATGTLHFQCCGALGDVAEWERLLLEQPAKWHQVWIGHPWVYARFEGDAVHFSDYFDYDAEPPTITARLTLPREEFVEALRAAVAELHGFFYLLRRVVLSRSAFDNKSALLAGLTAGYFADDDDE